MEQLTQTDPTTLTKARTQYAVTQVTKSLQRLRKGMTRFVGQNGRIIGAVTLGVIMLGTAARVTAQPRTSARFLPSFTNGFATGNKRLRRRMSDPISVGVLVSAGALISTGLVMLLRPRVFMGR